MYFRAYGFLLDYQIRRKVPPFTCRCITASRARAARRRAGVHLPPWFETFWRFIVLGSVVLRVLHE
jgi:hypothetical protein